MGKRSAFGLIAFAMASLGAFSAGATEDVDSPIAVVELFTSQGCNSCPKADAALAALAEQGDVVALAYHVDYWDYLGWKDTLASPENTERQRDYSRRFKNRAVYTPQVVVNGMTDLKGSKPKRLDAALRQAAMGGLLNVDVDLALRSDSLVVTIGEGAGADVETAILLVYFDETTDVAITQGKNRGKTISYVHTVRGFHSAGMWNGDAQELRMPLHDVMKKGSGGVAAIVQEIDSNGMPGAIRGAALIHHRVGS